jgi:hypothetical protein
MAFEKAKEYLEGYGLADRIIVTEQSGFGQNTIKSYYGR